MMAMADARDTDAAYRAKEAYKQTNAELDALRQFPWTQMSSAPRGTGSEVATPTSWKATTRAKMTPKAPQKERRDQRRQQTWAGSTDGKWLADTAASGHVAGDGQDLHGVGDLHHL